MQGKDKRHNESKKDTRVGGLGVLPLCFHISVLWSSTESGCEAIVESLWKWMDWRSCWADSQIDKTTSMPAEQKHKPTKPHRSLHMLKSTKSVILYANTCKSCQCWCISNNQILCLSTCRCDSLKLRIIKINYQWSTWLNLARCMLNTCINVSKWGENGFSSMARNRIIMSYWIIFCYIFIFQKLYIVKDNN